MAIVFDWYENPNASSEEEEALHPRIFMNGKDTVLYHGGYEWKPAIPENSEYQVLDIFDDTKIEKEILKILEELANNIFVI